MELTRRDFLKTSGATAGGLILYGVWNKDMALASPQQIPLHKKVGEKTTICPYCGVGCSIIMAVEEGRITNTEGDPDHPINQGTLCPKGGSLYQVANNEHRLTKVLYRAPGTVDWEEKSWDWAIEHVARRIKETRDQNWVAKDGEGNVINRTEAIASVGSVFPNDQ